MAPQRRIWFISDHHLGHVKVLTFVRSNGKLLRDFPSVNHMHEYMIEKHNSVVHPQDKVYFLGDVAINKSAMYLLHRFNGKKRLVRGNHDIYKTSVYSEYFEEIHGVRVFTGLPDRARIVATHVPLHPECMSRWSLNVHGHLHSNSIKDNRYVNVCVDYEGIDYTPVSMEELIKCIPRR